MAELLKNLYSAEFVSNLGNELRYSSSDFNIKKFQNSVFDKNWQNRELKDRMQHITEMISNSLEGNYLSQLKVLKKVAPKFNGLTALIFPNFVEKYGHENYNQSIEALAFFTQFSTSEFAIRPFLKNKPETIEVLYDWSKDKNHHLRRLASEGCRPLLPWGMKLEQFIIDPLPILPILKQLKNDKEDYVYRSVANNLNDISKHHPGLVLDLANQWIGQSATTDRVLKHALRTLLKKGNSTSMNLFGFGPIKKIVVDEFRCNVKTIIVGESTQLFFKFTNKGETAKFRFEYAVSFLKKNNSYTKKVFQISEKEVLKNGSESFVKKVDFKNLSTRKLHPGLHYIVLKINGVEKDLIEITLK